MSKSHEKKIDRQKKREQLKQQRQRQQRQAARRGTVFSSPIPPTFDAERVGVPAGFYGWLGRILTSLWKRR
ncbi:MAG: hypothetical protein WCD86_04915 [Ktedonobacteraceae bacterium]